MKCRYAVVAIFLTKFSYGFSLKNTVAETGSQRQITWYHLYRAFILCIKSHNKNRPEIGYPWWYQWNMYVPCTPFLKAESISFSEMGIIMASKNLCYQSSQKSSRQSWLYNSKKGVGVRFKYECNKFQSSKQPLMSRKRLRFHDLNCRRKSYQTTKTVLVAVPGQLIP